MVLIIFAYTYAEKRYYGQKYVLWFQKALLYACVA